MTEWMTIEESRDADIKALERLNIRIKEAEAKSKANPKNIVNDQRVTALYTSRGNLLQAINEKTEYINAVRDREARELASNKS